MSILFKHNAIERLTLVRVVRIDFKGDKSKAPRPTGILFAHNGYINNLAKLLHVLFNILLAGTVENSANKILHEVGAEPHLL